MKKIWERIQIARQLYGRILNPEEMRNWLLIEWGHEPYSRLGLADAWKIAGIIVNA